MALRLDDRDLVLAYQRGDADAFAELVREYRPQLLGHARRRLGCPERAEDAVQEALLRAMRAMPRFNGNYLVGPWLHRILSNVCADEGNRVRRELDKTTRLASSDKALLQPPNTEAELGLDLDHTELRDAVGSLSVEYRQALMLRFVEELSYEEVAEVAGISTQNARARVSRARAAVRSALKLAAALPVALAGLPAMAKAAAGVGLAAAVITPTVDSPVHRVTERVLPDAVVSVLAPLAVDVPAPSDPVVVPALPSAAFDSGASGERELAVDAAAAGAVTAAAEASETATAAAAAADADSETEAVATVDGVEGGEDSTEASETATAAAAAAVADSETEAVATVDGVEGGEASTEVGAANASSAADSGEPAASEAGSEAPAPAVVITSSGAADGAELAFVPAGADRFDVTGTVTVTITTTTTTSEPNGGDATTETVTTTEMLSVVAPSNASLTAVDPADPQAQQRFDALLVLQAGDSVVEMRLAARGAAADGDLPLEGFFTATQSDALTLAERGTMVGTLVFADDGTPQSLALTLVS